jgi:hypothetical protein
VSNSVEAPIRRDPPVPARARSITLLLLRVTVTAHLIAVALQPVLAGRYLSGEFDALELHATNASLLTSLSLFQLIAAVLFWLPGRGRGWPALVAALLFAAETLQIGYGYARELGLHIPLGVAIVVATILLTIGVWGAAMREPRRPLRRRARRAAR